MSSTEKRSQPALAEQPLGSALFCDLVGFTPLTERLDPETVERIQRDYYGVMRAIVEEHGGRVEEGSIYSGDAVIAVFDQDEDAVRAAASMCEAIGTVTDTFSDELETPLEVRVGIAGELDGAVRHQALAAPGEIVVSEPAWQHTRHAFRYAKRAHGYAYAGGIGGTSPI